MESLQIRVLGGLEVRAAGAAPLALPTRKSRALLVYLALHPGERHARGRLAALLWDRSAEEQARASLRQTLFTLRRALGGEAARILESDAESVWLEAERVEVDALAFERLAAQGTPAALAQAAACYRGDFLEGFSVRAEPFESWLMAERRRLRERALAVLEALLAAHEQQGAPARAIEAAGRLLELDPLHEPAHRALMRLYAAQGRREEALRQYRSCAQALERELGVEPAPATRELQRALREGGTQAPAGGGGAGVAQSIRFCNAPDGVRIAYATVGAGPPLVKAANWLNHLEFDWESPVYRHMLRELARDHLLLRYDARGNGLSDWDAADVSLDAFVRDLETVVDAAGVERFVLLGFSQGCAVSIAYAVRHPERVTHLVLHGGYARGWRVAGSPQDVERQEALLALTRSGWGQDNPAFREVFTTLFIPDASAEQKQWFNDLERNSTSPENAVRLQQVLGGIDVTALLPRVQAPTLVLHARREARIPFALGRELATGIPGARFVPLDSANHLVLEHEPAWPRWLAEVRGFLGTAGGGS